MTLVLVLVILPRRYVLHAGLRESGVSFPAKAAPFTPPPEQPRPAVVRPLPATPPQPGPAERFWDEVMPLLKAGRYERTFPLFQSYLRDHPTDRNVRREWAITLDRAGRSDMAAATYSALLREHDDPEVRLLYARSLRDAGHIDEAEEQYRILRRERPGDVAVAFESAQALAWGGHYEDAAEILSGILESHPDQGEARVELARAYYSAGRLEDARAALDALSPDQLATLGADQLQTDIVAALTPPPAPEPPEPSLTQRAEQALSTGEYRAAADLYEEALKATPADTALLRQYADVLQYRLEDMEGARESLLRLEPARAGDANLSFRIAQLQAWTGQHQEAMQRLEQLILAQAADTSGAQPDLPRRAAERALLGDLYRWDGLRVMSAATYERALVDDSTNASAQTGLETLHSDVDKQVENEENPRLGTAVSSYSDSDDFTSLDLALEGVALDGTWVVGARSGSRIVRGDGVDGLTGSERGLFADVQLGRWWRWGTLRTALRLGMERFPVAGTDAMVDASLLFDRPGSFRTEVVYHHGPAYPVTVTRSSLMAGVRMDRLTLTASRQLFGPWSLALLGDVARLSAPDAASWPNAKSSTRLEGSVSLGRSFSPGLTLGVSGDALTYTNAAPVSNAVRLFWDPKAVFSLGVYAQWSRSLGDRWDLSGRVAPSFALIDERTRSGFDRVPHISADGGLAYHTGGVSTKLDLFYYQGRFNGYRAYGARLSVSATDLFRRGGR
ncbi:MAG: tetratricopeptide repeat protein [Gemmatimonadetes bacterium]|nr:tetratricopeptide repeat protein [Gemmatimonadota bacterium]